MTEQTDNPEHDSDDAEGHTPRVRIIDTEATTEDDVEGHVNFINPAGPQGDDLQR